MTTMRIDVTEQVAAWIANQVQLGAYGSQSEVVQHALRSFIAQQDPLYFSRAGSTVEHESDSSLVDQIVEAVKKNEILEPFGFDEIFAHFGQRFSESNLRTCLANFAIEERDGAKGWHVAQGRAPRFTRVSRGQYRILRTRNIKWPK